VTRKSGTNAGVTPEHHPREGTPRALRGGGAPQEGVTPGGSPQEGHLRRGHLRRVTPEGPPQEGPPQEGYLRRVPPTSGGSPQICASGRIVVVTTFWHSRHLAQRYVAQVFLAANLPFWLGIGAAQKGAGSKPLERRHWVAIVDRRYSRTSRHVRFPAALQRNHRSPIPPRRRGWTKPRGNSRRPLRCDCALPFPKRRRPEFFHVETAPIAIRPLSTPIG
jgi:hypothetical protein